MRLPSVVGMKLQLSNSLLTYLCRQIECGRPLAALMRAREYLPTSSPLWRAMVKKATPILQSSRYESAREWIAMITSGVSINELSFEGREALLTIREGYSNQSQRFSSTSIFSSRTRLPIERRRRTLARVNSWLKHSSTARSTLWRRRFATIEG